MINYQQKTKSRITQSTDFNTCELSVLLGMDNLSYAIYDRKIIDVIEFNSLCFNYSQRPDTILTYLEKVYEENKILHHDFNIVKVIYQNHLCTLVPNELYSSENHKDYLKYNVKTFGDDLEGIDVLPEVNAKNLYLIPKTIDKYFSEKYAEKYQNKHHVSILINALMRYFSKTDKSYFFVNVYQHSIQIIYIKSGKLQFYNTFLYYTKEDFIYYILFVMEQLGLNPDIQPLTFLGQVTTDDDNYKMAYKYIRHLNFFSVDHFNISDTFYADNPQIQKHFYFELLNQL